MPSTNKPIFVATHPRACSTAFERVFMTRGDILTCVHEPFGDAFYYGPERLSERFADDDEAREKSGFAHVTYKHVMDKLEELMADKDKRVFIKDIAHYLLPPDGKPASLAPSLVSYNDSNTNNSNNGTTTTTTNSTSNSNGNTSSNNPTVMPEPLLRKFHFTFLIRHPRRAIPSYYRCTIPPLDKVTGFYHFLPSEAGYDELRRLFDFLKERGAIGPKVSQASRATNGEDGVNGDASLRNGSGHGAEGSGDGEVEITVIDADDLLDNPDKVIRSYCDAVGIDYSPDMLKWGDEASQRDAVNAFEKWKGFHEDAIGSTSLKPRENKLKTPTIEEENNQWREKYGEKAAKMIRECVDANVADYEYLKSFAIKI